MTKTILSAWIAFSVAAFGWAVAFAVIDGDNPLRSDDPYIVGFLFGTIAAGAAVVFSLGDAIARWTGIAILRDLIYTILVFLFFGMWWFLNRNAPEGRDIIAFICMGGLFTCVAVWPLSRFPLPRALVQVITCFGVLFVFAGTLVTASFWLR